MSIAKAFLGYFKPRVDDLSVFEAKLTIAIGKLDPKDKFAYKRMTQLVEFTRSIIKSRSL